MNCRHCHYSIASNERWCPNCHKFVPESLIGQLLGYKYELLGVLGMGGMGAVYRARRHIGDEVVVKILLPNLSQESARFHREAEAAARVKHSNVVVIHDSDEARGELPAFIAMEMVKGVPLRHLLQSEGKLEPARAIMLMRRICAGVGAAHRLGVVHRDLKPENVMVVPPEEDGETETIKVLDFGIAKLLDRKVTQLTQDGMVLGTAYYMAPEQWRSEEVDARADVYSLGVMLYEMLTGEWPFTGRTRDVLMMKHLSEPPPSLTLDRDAPSELEAVIRRALAKERDARQQTATELWRELEAMERARNNTAEIERLTEERYVLQLALRELERQLQAMPDDDEPIQKEEKPANTKRRKEEESENPEITVEDSNKENPKLTVQSAMTVTLPSLLTFGFNTVTVDARGQVAVRHKRRAGYFVEDLGGGVKLEMVEIPAGSFLMGSPESEAGRGNYEIPQHEVRISVCYMGKYQITQSQWNAIMGKNQSAFHGGDLPVESVSWNDAIEFCRKLSAKTHREYRLPASAEWEYACRAGSKSPFAFGETITPEIVNYNGVWPYGNAPKGTYRKKTVPVGSLGVANSFGLYDMHGNVWEWCQLIFADDRGHSENVAVTRDAPMGRELRGGSWRSYAGWCRSAYRPDATPEGRHSDVGLRVVTAARIEPLPSRSFA